MAYLNDDIFTPAQLGLHESDLSGFFGDLWKGTTKVAGGITAIQTAQAQQEMLEQQARAGMPGAQFQPPGFLQQHGMKLAIVGVAGVVLFLVLKKKKS